MKKLLFISSIFTIMPAFAYSTQSGTCTRNNQIIYQWNYEGSTGTYTDINGNTTTKVLFNNGSLYYAANSNQNTGDWQFYHNDTYDPDSLWSLEDSLYNEKYTNLSCVTTIYN